jgi:hypothetical protein
MPDGRMSIPIYVTDPHKIVVGYMNIELACMVNDGNIEVIVDGMPNIVEESRNRRRATPGAIMYIDTKVGRHEVGTVK